MTYTQRTLLLLLSFSSLVAAINLAQCLEDLKNDPDATGGVDSHGHPTSAAQAVGLTYKACTARCGSSVGNFNWSDFVPPLSSWLLPWFALVGRLPFGSGKYTDDIASAVINLGSPALAAYSLVLTSLNVRSVYHRARRTTHSSKYTVAKALASLQQPPLELTRDEHLLGFISITDQWRREIVDRLDSRNVWSIATGLFVGWVAVTFVFTVVNSFVFLDNPSDDSYDAHALGALWLWLLCLVIGWFRVPAFTCSELQSAIVYANQGTQEAARRIRQVGRTAREAIDRAKAKITDRRLRVLKGPKRQVVDPVPEVDEESKKVEAEAIQEHAESSRQGVEPQVDPPLSPIRYKSTISQQLSPEHQQRHDYLSVSANPTANRSATSVARSTGAYSVTESSIHLETDDLLVPKEFNSLNRDEFRLAATFNYSRIMHYLILVDDVFRALDKAAHERAHERDEKGRPIPENTPQPARGVVFPPGALTSMFTASIFALILQCGTTVAASMIVVSTPTVGVGCRALGYIVYGAISIIIMFLTMISTILARISETRDEGSAAIKRFTAFISIALRRISLFLAYANATGLVILSCLLLSGSFDTCYCKARVIGRGSDSYLIMSYEGWVPTMRNSRIAATILLAICMTIYITFVWIMSSLPVETDLF